MRKGRHDASLCTATILNREWQRWVSCDGGTSHFAMHAYPQKAAPLMWKPLSHSGPQAKLLCAAPMLLLRFISQLKTYSAP